MGGNSAESAKDDNQLGKKSTKLQNYEINHKGRSTGNKTFPITFLETTQRSSSSKEPHVVPRV
jgi:hypothetical protein